MDIKEIAKEMTREEFLLESDKTNFTEYDLDCPNVIGLKADCRLTCKSCWEQAVKDIKFKGEDKVKELTFKEVITNIKEGERWICTDKSLAIQYISMEDDGTLCIGHDNQPQTYIQRARFIKEQQPVTFEEVLNSDKKCRVEHELINEEELFEDYNEFDVIMYQLSSGLEREDLREVIKNGKWYIEE